MRKKRKREAEDKCRAEEEKRLAEEETRLADEKRRAAAERKRKSRNRLAEAECNWKNMMGNNMDGHNGATVQKLIDEGADVDAQDTVGWTALVVAILHGGEHAEAIMRVLVDAEADVNKQDEDGSTALMYAAEEGGEGRVRWC